MLKYETGQLKTKSTDTEPNKRSVIDRFNARWGAKRYQQKSHTFPGENLLLSYR